MDRGRFALSPHRGGNVAIRIDYASGATVRDVTSDGAREGIRVEHSPSIASPSDLSSAGKTATGNLSGDFRVIP